VLVAGGALLAPPALHLLGLHGRAFDMGWAYYRVYLAGSAAVIYAYCTGALLQARGELTRMALNQAAGLLTTAVVTPVLMGLAGFGLPGAAFGTMAGAIVAAVLNTASLRRMEAVALVRPTRAIVGRILSIGQSGMLMQLSYFAQGFLVFWTLARIGTERDLAFMGVTYRLVLFGVYLATGFSRGLQPLVGISYGAGDGRRVARAFLVFNAGALAVLIGPWLVAIARPAAVIGVLAPGLSISALDAVHFRTYLSVLLVAPFLLTSLTLYQAIDLPWQVTAFGLVRLVGFFVPAVLLLPRWFGLSGIYDALAGMDFALTILVGLNGLVTVIPRLRNLRGQIVCLAPESIIRARSTI
jgi:Na+-driven multidrug efflux pump